MISKALSLPDYEEMRPALAYLERGIRECTRAGVPLYLPHHHRKWEYGSVIAAASTYLPRGLTYLDFGAGRSPLGPTLGLFYGAKGVEVDNDPRLEDRKGVGHALGIDHAFICGDLSEYEGEPVDLVASVSVMEHLPPEEQSKGWGCLISRVKSKGVLAVTVDYSPDSKKAWSYDTERKTKFGPQDIEGIVERLRTSGFVVDLDLMDYGPHVFDYTFFRIIARRGL